MYYYALSTYLKNKYGEKVRKISLNAGFTCPNRDEALGKKGCIFCNENAFSQFAGTKLSLDEQISSSIEKAKKRGVNKFIAYFQNATNTNAKASKLKETYQIIRKFPEIIALSVSTRPDCIDEEKLNVLKGFMPDYEVWVEYGVQTVHDKTLEVIGRGHNFASSAEAIRKTREKGIKTAAHIVLGLPGESREDMITTAKEMAKLEVDGIKLHALQVFKDTVLEKMYSKREVKLLKRQEYIQIVCDFLENLSPNCVILRMVSDSNRDFLIAPGWVNDKLLVISDIEAELKKRGSRQGSFRFT